MRLGCTLSIWALSIAAAILAGCDDAARRNRSPTAPAPPAPAPGLTHTLSGRVLESTAQGVRPLANTSVGISLFAPPGVVPAQIDMPSAVTNPDGRYVVSDLPHGYRVRLQAGTVYYPGWLHPCGAAARMDGDAVVDIEVVDSPETPRTIRDSPRISGVVYETTAEGRRPIPGATVGFEALCWTGEFPNAWTRTDSSGRYELCRLSPPDVLGAGCVTAFTREGSGWSGLVTAQRDVVVDIEVKPARR